MEFEVGMMSGVRLIVLSREKSHFFKQFFLRLTKTREYVLFYITELVILYVADAIM